MIGGRVMRVSLSLLMILCGWACGSKPVQKDLPGAPIPGLNLSGDWFSPEFGTMNIKQDGIAISGEYEDRFSKDRNGHFRGVIKGDIVRLTWIQPGNPKAAIMPKKGMAWLRVKKRGAALEGEFGYDNSHDDGGLWTATKSTEEQRR
jgi:hypothetical protein